MKYKAYKLNFTFDRDRREGGTLLTKVHTFTRTVLAEDEAEAFLEAAKIKGENQDINCKFAGFEEVKTGRIWKVTMDGTAHLRNSEDKLVDREDMHKVMFVDALDMYDAEQVAYRIWERQVVEEGWNDISIFRTLVDVPKHPMTDKEVA